MYLIAICVWDLRLDLRIDQDETVAEAARAGGYSIGPDELRDLLKSEK